MCEVLCRNTVQDWSSDFNNLVNLTVSKFQENLNNVLYQLLMQNVGKILILKSERVWLLSLECLEGLKVV